MLTANAQAILNAINNMSNAQLAAYLLLTNYDAQCSYINSFTNLSATAYCAAQQEICEGDYCYAQYLEEYAYDLYNKRPNCNTKALFAG